MAKVLIAVMREKKLPKRPEKSPISLEKRVQYAIDCIEADLKSADKARVFLRGVRRQVDNAHLVSRIDEVLNDGT